MCAFKMSTLSKNLRTLVTLKRLNVTKAVNSLQGSLQGALPCKLHTANLALVSAVISAMNSSYV